MFLFIYTGSLYTIQMIQLITIRIQAEPQPDDQSQVEGMFCPVEDQNQFQEVG